MKTNNEQYIYTPFVEQAEVKQNKISELVSNLLYHWPLVILSLITAIVLAFVYISSTNSVYNVKAKISINDNKNKETNVKEAAMEQLSLSTGNKLVESEVEVIKSRPLIRNVVDSLQLWVNYSVKQRLKTVDVYTSSPFRLQLIKPATSLSTQNFEVNIVDGRQFKIIHNEEEITGYFGKPVTASFGSFTLLATDKLANYKGETIHVDMVPLETAVTAYQEKISTSFNKQAPLVELNIEDQVPLRGIRTLNTLISVYKNSNIQNKNKETLTTLKFIDDRLTSLRGELSQAEKTVEGYKSSVGLTEISSKSQYYLDNAQSNDGKLGAVSVQLNIINGIERYVNSEKNSSSPPATIGIEDPGLIALVGKLSALMLEKDQLLATAPESNPIFFPINSQIKSTKTAIKNSISNIKASLVSTNRELRKISSGFESSIKDIPVQERQYVSFKRQMDIKQGLYIYLLQKREEVALSYATTLKDARIVENAYAGKPESKKKGPITVALLLGVLFPVGLLSFRKNLRNKVLTVNDIQLGTAVPVIAELIHESGKNELVMLKKGAFAITEQIRNLRTNILQQTSGSNNQVILFGSSVAGEGKSFVASNFALSLAATGKKTIILELDMRKPRISKIFKTKNTTLGISSFLEGKAELSAIIEPSVFNENLSIIGSGPIPMYPSELLEGDKMADLINQLKEEYDHIIIDSPPMHLVTDGLILSQFADVCLYMVRHNHTAKTELNFVEKLYQEDKVRNMFIVFNGVFMDSRFGYALDYGYYSEKSNKKLGSGAFTDLALRF